MDARRVPVRAWRANPRGGHGGCGPTPFNSQDRVLLNQLVAVLGGFRLGKPQVLCTWGNLGSGAVPAGRAQPAHGRFGDLSDLQDGWQRWGVRGHVCSRCTRRTAAGLPIVSAVSPPSAGPVPAGGTQRGAPLSPLPRSAVCSAPRPCEHLAPGGWAAPATRSAGDLGKLPARFCLGHGTSNRSRSVGWKFKGLADTVVAHMCGPVSSSRWRLSN